MPEVVKNLYRGKKPVDVPFYSFTDVVRLLHLRVHRVPPSGMDAVFMPLGEEDVGLAVTADELRDLVPHPDRAYFTFRSLVRIFQLSALAKQWWWEFGSFLSSDKHRRLPTIFLYGDRSKFRNVDREMIAMIEGIYHRRIDYDGDTPVRLYPFTRQRADDDSPRLITIDPRYSFGNPIIVSKNVRVDVLVSRFLAGETVAELAEDYDLQPTEVEEALRYESRHVE